MSIFTRPVLQINLNNLVENYKKLREIAAPAAAAAVVKDNAYGLGAEMIAETLYTKADCRNFFVAHAVEGERIAPLVPDAEIYVLQGIGADSLELFEKYKLVLSCDNVSVKKIAVCDSGEKYYGSITGIGDVVGDHFRYYCIIDTEVKTESADGKISKLGVFADEGEIKKIKFLMICDLDTTLNELSISRIYFD